MTSQGGCPLTPHEESCIRSLKRIAKKMECTYESALPFSASGTLWVMLGEGNGNTDPEYTGEGYGEGGVNPKNAVCIITMIDIPNDGGDW